MPLQLCQIAKGSITNLAEKFPQSDIFGDCVEGPVQSKWEGVSKERESPTYNVLQQHDIVWLVSNLGRVRQDLVKLAGFRKSRNDLGRYICAKIDAEGEIEIMRPNDITKLF